MMPRWPLPSGAMRSIDANAEEIIALAFQMDPLVREKRRESVEFLRRLIVGDGNALDFDHLVAGKVFVPLAVGADADFDELADPQSVIAEQVGAEVDIIRDRGGNCAGGPAASRSFPWPFPARPRRPDPFLRARKNRAIRRVNWLFGMPPWMRAGEASAMAWSSARDLRRNWLMSMEAGAGAATAVAARRGGLRNRGRES